MDTFEGKIALVTGAASGIGLAMSEAFAAEGMHVVMADVEAPALDAACAGLGERGYGVSALSLDVTDRAAMEAARERILAEHGALHLLCNNAGVNADGTLDEVSYADWDWVLGVNLGGVVNGITTFLPELKRHGPGAHLVNTGSVGGLVGMPGIGIYNASKFAVVGLSEALRAELLECGTGVSVLCPGLVATALPTSQRNRPAHLTIDSGSPATTPDDWEENPLMTMAMAPADVARQVVDAVRMNRFFILTHPEFREVIAERNAALDAAFLEEADPEKSAAMRSMVRPLN